MCWRQIVSGWVSWMFQGGSKYDHTCATIHTQVRPCISPREQRGNDGSGATIHAGCDHACATINSSRNDRSQCRSTTHRERIPAELAYAREFISRCLVRDASSKMRTDTIHRAFRDWCFDRGVKSPVSDRQLAMDLRRLGIRSERKHNRCWIRGWAIAGKPARETMESYGTLRRRGEA